MAESESALTTVQRENKRLQEEIQKLMMHNTKLQRELMTLNASREQLIADGHERVATLTDELKQVDAELTTVRGDCDRIIAVICHHKENSPMRSLAELSSELAGESVEEDDFQSDHSTASTASTSSFHSQRGGGSDWKSRSDISQSSNSSRGRPPLSNSKKMSVDIDQERVPQFTRSMSTMPTASATRKLSTAKPATSAHPQVPSGAARDTIMSRISRSVKKAQSMPQMSPDRPSVQHTLGNSNHSPMLSYKANSVLRATQTHLNNFRRHSGPYRRNLDTVVL